MSATRRAGCALAAALGAGALFAEEFDFRAVLRRQAATVAGMT